MTKRLIGLIVILVMGLSLAACAACDNSAGLSDYDDESTSTSEDSSEGDDSGQDSSSSEGTAAQEDDSTSQSDDSASQSDSGDNSDDSDSDTDGGSGSDNNSGTGGTSGTQTGTGSAQSGFAITRQPVDTSVAVGASLILSVEASGSGTLSYQWYTSLTNSYDGGIALMGKNAPSASINTTYPFVQYYYCVITQSGTGRTLTTNIVTASAVGDAPTPTPEPTPTPAPTPAPILPPLTDNVAVWVKGVQITPANYTDVLDSGTHSVYFNGDTNTLTLNGANVEYDGAGVKTSVIHSELAELTIDLIGENTLEHVPTSTGDFAIKSTEDLTITGKGQLIAIGNISEDAISSSGPLTILDGVIYAIGGSVDSGWAGSGINAYESLTISGGTVNATGGNTGTSFGASGIYAYESLTISGGTVNATGGNSNSSNDTDRGGSGISTIDFKALTFTGGTINVTGGNGSSNAKGGHGISSGAGPMHNIILGTASNPFNGTLTAIGGTGSTNGTAFDKDATSTNFGTGMLYFTSTDGTSWTVGNDVSALPVGYYNNFGLHFGTTAP